MSGPEGSCGSSTHRVLAVHLSSLHFQVDIERMRGAVLLRNKGSGPYSAV